MNVVLGTAASFSIGVYDSGQWIRDDSRKVLHKQ